MVNKIQLLPPLLKGAVGRPGKSNNFQVDVMCVQYLFNKMRMTVQSPFAEDGVCNQALINAICHFQQIHLKFKHPDGVIEPSGKTFYSLIVRALKAPVQNSTPYFLPGQRTVQTLAQSLVDKYLLDSAHLINKTELDKLSLRVAKLAGSASLTENDYINAAAYLDNKVEINIIKAFSTVESGGRSGFNELNLPVIAFEGHIFRKYTHRVYDDTHPSLSYRYSKKAGKNWLRNNKNQATAWQTLSEAFELDAEAALKSASWGAFQIMGFNFKSAGYKDVFSFANAMKESAEKHLIAFLNFCATNPALLLAMQNKDFRAMAENYNGMDYGTYDQKIKQAYEKFS